MNSFLKVKKTIFTFSLISLVLIPIFGVNILISFLGNIIILLILIPILLLILFFIGFNSFQSKFNKCNECGAISLGLSDTCFNCGANLNDISKRSQFDKKPSESTIEVQAEEIK